MDDLFIQEEVVVKTEPLENESHFGDNLTEKFLLDGPNNDDLMAYLNHSNSKDKNYIKKESFGADEPPNIFETGNHFMDPDMMIAHYEEVVQDISTSPTIDDSPILMEPPKKEVKLKKSTRKRRCPKVDSSPKTRKRSYKGRKTEEEDRSRGFSFECSLCMFTTENEGDLKQHMLDHIGGPDTDTFIEESHNGEAYSCLFCSFVSVSADLFRDHIKYKHSGTSRGSRGLGKRSKVELSSPLPSHTLPSEDDEADDDEDDDDISINNLSGEDNEKRNCKLCIFSARCKDELNKHMVKCHSDKLLRCSFCSFFTIYNSTLKRHELRHSQNHLYPCKHCNFSTFNLSIFNNHIATHMEEKPYACDECRFRGKTKESLRQHKKNHSGDMPYLCSYCSYKAGKKSRIIRHERIHTGERPYSCPHCTFKCNQGSTLKIHIRRHTGEKPYECSLCSFRAVSKCSLNAHLRKHKSYKGTEFVCSVCEQIYNNPTALRKHEKIHEEQNEGFLKEVVNKKRKSDQLAKSTTGASMPSEPSIPVKRSRKRRRNSDSKRKEKKNNEETLLEEEEEEEEANPLTLSPIARLYKCTLCSFRCSRFMELSDHMTAHKKTAVSDGFSPDSIPKKYRCTPCNLAFSRKREMKAHLKEKHEGKRNKEVTIKLGDYVLSVNEN